MGGLPGKMVASAATPVNRPIRTIAASNVSAPPHIFSQRRGAGSIGSWFTGRNLRDTPFPASQEFGANRETSPVPG